MEWDEKSCSKVRENNYNSIEVLSMYKGLPAFDHEASQVMKMNSLWWLYRKTDLWLHLKYPENFTKDRSIKGTLPLRMYQDTVELGAISSFQDSSDQSQGLYTTVLEWLS